MFRCVSGGTLKTISFIWLGLPVETLVWKVPVIRIDEFVAVMYCEEIVCKVGLPNLVHVCVEQKLSLAPLSTTKTNDLRSVSTVSGAWLFPGTELILWMGLFENIILTFCFLSFYFLKHTDARCPVLWE